MAVWRNCVYSIRELSIMGVSVRLCNQNNYSFFASHMISQSRRASIDV